LLVGLLKEPGRGGAFEVAELLSAGALGSLVGQDEVEHDGGVS